MPDPLNHLLISGFTEGRDFRSTWQVIPPPPPQRDRASHGQRLLGQIAVLRANAEHVAQRRAELQLPEGDGMTVALEIATKGAIDFKNLEWRSAGIEILSAVDAGGTEVVALHVPAGGLAAFEKRIRDYLGKDVQRNPDRPPKPANATLVNAIENFRRAAFDERWTDDVPPPAGGAPAWFQVWLRTGGRPSAEVRAAFGTAAERLGITLDAGYVSFPGRPVVAARSTRAALEQALDLLDLAAELRNVTPSAEFFLSDQTPREQADWARELLARFATRNPHQVPHRLESVKILPPNGANPPHLYGWVTAQAAGKVEGAHPARRRTFAMMTTAIGGTAGKPSEWSAAVGQAWNALTVGACTHLMQIDRQRWPSLTAIAGSGQLSPSSTTTLMWGRSWPFKPDVVAEGGNGSLDGRHAPPVTVGPESLRLLTTASNYAREPLAETGDTSAAAAEVARICAHVKARYPDYWYVKRAGSVKLNELKLHALPWPVAELEALGGATVELRITLSYFVEPNPSRRGWKSKFRYQSHGLRFAVKGSVETDERFLQRINKLERAELEENEPQEAMADPDRDHWFVGARLRSRGSLHSDVWVGTAAQLAQKSHIAVFPVGGWWKDWNESQRHSVPVRYSLVVGLEVIDDVDVDLYTPIADTIAIAAEVGG